MAPRLSSAILRTQTDRRLVALAREGSEPAFEALVERYRRPLQAYCRRLLLPREGAEDVVQQAFLATWQALTRGTDIADVRAWLYRTTHNTALNALKRSGYRSEELSDALRGAGAPEDDLERRTVVRQALAGLAQLPELQRQALLRTAVEGHSHEQVARELGLSDGAVRGLVYRARVTLRAAATAVAPSPLIGWVAGASGRSAPTAERIGELVAGGGSAGAAALLAKGGAAVMATGALAGGVAVVDRTTGERDRTPETTVRAELRREDAPAATPFASAARAVDEAGRRGGAARAGGRRSEERPASGPTEQSRDASRERGRGRSGEDDEDPRPPATIAGPAAGPGRADDRSGPGGGAVEEGADARGRGRGRGGGGDDDDDDPLDSDDHSGSGSGGSDDDPSDEPDDDGHRGRGGGDVSDDEPDLGDDDTDIDIDIDEDVGDLDDDGGDGDEVDEAAEADDDLDEPDPDDEPRGRLED